MNENDKTKPYVHNFGNYSIFSEIGSGGMGKVYSGFDNKLQRAVAIKIPLDKMSAPEEKRFLREAQVMAQLKHPNIVSLYEIGTINARPFLAMELIDGQNLSEMKSQLSVKKIVTYMIDICLAVHYAHEQKVIHRDLKPSNIMITKDNRPVVMDFGIAKRMKGNEEISRTGVLIGSLLYMSPEQAMGKNRELDHLTDVYSLGMILYNLLTLRRPFSQVSQTSLVFAILREHPVAPSKVRKKVPTVLDDICFKAIAKNKKDRYTSAREMAEDLENFLHKRPVQASKTSQRLLWKYFLLQHYRKIVVVMAIFFIGIVALQFQQTMEKKDQQIAMNKQQQQKHDEDLKQLEKFKQQKLQLEELQKVKQQAVNENKNRNWSMAIQHWERYGEMCKKYERSITADEYSFWGNSYFEHAAEVTAKQGFHDAKSGKLLGKAVQYLHRSTQMSENLQDVRSYIKAVQRLGAKNHSQEAILKANIWLKKNIDKETKKELTYSLGVLCCRDGKYQKAIDFLSDAEDLGVKHGWLYFFRGECYYALGSMGNDKSWLTKAEGDIIEAKKKAKTRQDFQRRCRKILSDIKKRMGNK